MSKTSTTERRALVALVALALGCGSPPPAKAPSSTPGPASATAPTPETAPRSEAWKLPPRTPRAAPQTRWSSISLEPYRKVLKLKGLSPPPAKCAAFAGRAPASGAPDKLAEIVAEPNPDARDALLAAREAKATTDRALVRLVRADAAPVECADAIVDPYLAKKTTNAEDEVDHALIGLALAGKLARTAHAPPQIAAKSDKPKVKAFIQGPLKTWMLEQASLIEQLSLVGRELGGYGRGVAAIEAGTAELRLVDNIRSSPVPKEWDPELRQIYEAALDEALEPRKTRGRDAALVGLADLAAASAVHDARVDRARAILSKLYGGRRIDALDALLLPPSADDASRGPASSYLHYVDARGAEKALSARASFDAGRLYWQRADFVDAAYAAERGKSAEDRLVLALALALAQGPANAAEMMRVPSPSALGLGHTEALDALGAEGGPLAGVAAFDAAHLRSLSAPDGAAAAAYFADVAARFRKAESVLSDPAQKTKAGQRAADAEAAAGTVGRGDAAH